MCFADTFMSLLDVLKVDFWFEFALIFLTAVIVLFAELYVNGESQLV